MTHTQVELESPSGATEVWWIPVREERIGIGQLIIRKIGPDRILEPWTVTQICTSLPEESIPTCSRIAREYIREHSSRKPAYIST